MLNITRNVTLRFPNNETMWIFDKEMPRSDDYWYPRGSVPTVIGGFEDGHFEEIYPLKFWKIRRFLNDVRVFNKYSRIYKKAKVGIIEIIG